ncbi:NUDIX hydrolase [Nocardia beijingensis]|uniref:NUDIX hydrolase n=1 Tax=Nocardia beijingensis TaxID=95162 RepID=UPI00344F5ED3
MSAAAETHPPMATPRVAAGIVVVNGDSVLMVRPTYKPYWDIPGGYVEPGESPRQACVREVHEELGVVVTELQLAAVDWAPNDREGDKMLFLFVSPDLNGIDAATLQFPDRELAEARYVKLDQLDEFTIPRLAQRLTATVKAVLAGEVPLYLEHGGRS